MINFDSTNWESIKDTINKLNEAGEMQFGKTSDDEYILFDVGRNEDGDYLITEVLQHNGWMRRNEYYPNDHSVCETYKKVK